MKQRTFWLGRVGTEPWRVFHNYKVAQTIASEFGYDELIEVVEVTASEKRDV